MVNSNYFFIDSSLIKGIETSIYGWYITDDSISSEIPKEEFEPVDGCFVYIKRLENRIVITQDWLGSYGLYLYKDNNYFAISNSFILLVDKIKKDHRISLNEDYANYLLAGAMVPLAYAETMVNEIELLDRRAIISIDFDNNLTIENRDFEEYTIDLDSSAAFDIIDNWFYSWTNRIKNIYSNTTNIFADLSGGFDSRLTFMLFLKSGIFNEKTRIRTREDKLHTHNEDYQIAKEITETYNIKLNAGILDSEKTILNVSDVLDNSFYPKLCIHTQMYYRTEFNNNVLIHVCGLGGELIRNYWTMPREVFTDTEAARSKKHPEFSQVMEESIRRVLNTSYKCVDDNERKFGRTIDPNLFTLMLYRDTRTRYQISRSGTEAFNSNEVLLCPLTDHDLIKLKFKTKECFDDHLLLAVLFDRFEPGLMDFKVQGRRFISDETRNYAHMLNEKYPKKQYQQNSQKIISKNKDALFMHKSLKIENDFQYLSTKPNEIVKKTYESQHIKELVYEKYGQKLYDRILKESKTIKYFPLSRVIVTLGICKILDDQNASITNSISSPGAYLDACQNNRNGFNKKDLLDFHPYLDAYKTLRIDCKNRGSSSNDIIVLNKSDQNLKILKPDWIGNSSGNGVVIRSLSGILYLELKCVNKGVISISFKGIDCKRADKSRVPFYIDLKRIIVNDTIVLNENCTVWHDDPFLYKKAVKDNDTLRIFVEWEPHDDRRFPIVD